MNHTKLICCFFLIAMCFCLSGCHTKHDWQEATCTEPKTCTTCKETKGEALGHTWADATCNTPKTCSKCNATEGTVLEHSWIEATCTTPKTCSRCNTTEGTVLEHSWADATCNTPKTCTACGIIEGEPLEHLLKEANYQEPETCTLCEQTFGEPLQPTEYSISASAKLDEVYDFEIPCYENESKSTISKLKFTDYKIFDSDDTHPAKEGYEWKSITMYCVIGDDMGREYGYNLGGYWYTDYYNYTPTEDGHFIVNYYGIEYPECTFTLDASNSGWGNNEQYGWSRTLTIQYNISVLVPKNYDGFIFGFCDTQSNFWDVEEVGDYWNQISPSDYIYFRFE